MLAEQIVRDTNHRIFFAVVRVGKLYLDFLHDCVVDAPKWGWWWERQWRATK
jgi:hypothetical protein